MDKTHEFLPRWASPPGGTIQDALEEQGLSHAAFARSIGVSRSQLTGLLSGRETISIELARRISTSIGGSVEFWLTRDGQYRDDVTRVEADLWAESLPAAQMAGFGWIDKPTDWQDQIASCLEFFDVSDLAEWQRTYGAMLDGARFRTSDKAGVDANATAAWLRKAELDAARISCRALGSGRVRKLACRPAAADSCQRPKAFRSRARHELRCCRRRRRRGADAHRLSCERRSSISRSSEAAHRPERSVSLRRSLLVYLLS